MVMTNKWTGTNMRNICLFIGAVALTIHFSSCAKLPIDPAIALNKTSNPSDTVLFAVIGDYGQDSPSEGRVADMVKNWNPEFIVTMGDNNYPLGSAATIVNNVGKYYCDYIYNPDAPADRVCNGRAAQEKKNRFFPAPGNHDNYAVPPIKPYLDYFTLPGDERNYDFVWGPVHFFSLNTGKTGNIDNTTENWLKDGLTKSTAPFKVVYFHHPPYSAGNHGSSLSMRLPYADWGANAVLAGHEHFYMRVNDNTVTDLIYLILGNSGNENLYSCNANPLDASRFTVNCDNSHFGALKVTATKTKLLFQYFTTDNPNTPTDVYEITK